MNQGAESTWQKLKRKPPKIYAILGGVVFTAGILMTLVSWTLYREVWITSGVVTLVGAFLLTHSLIARSTRME